MAAASRLLAGLITCGMTCLGLVLTADAAEVRVALVVGNSDYAEPTPLPNAAADARLVSDFLQAHGFEVDRLVFRQWVRA